MASVVGLLCLPTYPLRQTSQGQSSPPVIILSATNRCTTVFEATCQFGRRHALCEELQARRGRLDTLMRASYVAGRKGSRNTPQNSRMVMSSLNCSESSWCGRGDLNPHDRLGSADFLTTSAFAAPPRQVCGLDYPFTLLPRRFRCCPSSLYTFPEVLPGLARDCHFRFPRLWAVLLRQFPDGHSSLPKSAVSADFTTPA